MITDTSVCVWLSPANTYSGVYSDEIKVLQKDYTDLCDRFPNCWRNVQKLWCCKAHKAHERQRVWGHPNKYFHPAKIASVIYLSCLLFVYFFKMAQKRRLCVPNFCCKYRLDKSITSCYITDINILLYFWRNKT